MFYFSTYIPWTEVWIINTQLILYLILNVYYRYIVNVNRCRPAGTQNAGIVSIYETYMRTMKFVSPDTRQEGLYQADVKHVTRAER